MTVTKQTTERARALKQIEGWVNQYPYQHREYSLTRASVSGSRSGLIHLGSQLISLAMRLEEGLSKGKRAKLDGHTLETFNDYLSAESTVSITEIVGIKNETELKQPRTEEKTNPFMYIIGLGGLLIFLIIALNILYTAYLGAEYLFNLLF